MKILIISFSDATIIPFVVGAQVSVTDGSQTVSNGEVTAEVTAKDASAPGLIPHTYEVKFGRSFRAGGDIMNKNEKIFTGIIVTGALVGGVLLLSKKSGATGLVDFYIQIRHATDALPNADHWSVVWIDSIMVTYITPTSEVRLSL